MFQILKSIAEAENEAKRIMEKARVQAEDMLQKSKEQSEKVYEETYWRTVSEEKERFKEEERKTLEAANFDAQNILRKAEEQVKEIQVKAKQNLRKAVQQASRESLQ